MNIEYAREILVALADGVNPATGELLSAEDVCNQPDVIRALHTVLNTLGNASSAPKKNRLENAGKPWSPEEDDALREEYRQGMKVSQIAKLHIRSRGAITARLVRIGEVRTPYEVYWRNR